jgi:DNA-binding MarR family transcriptional regulator
MSWYGLTATIWDMAQKNPRRRDNLDTREYALLAGFRYALRAFMRFSETAAEGVGLTAQHYQALLVVRGCPEDFRVTINDLAQQLLIRHHSAVGLVDRLERQGLVTREPSPTDGRKVHLRLTVKGERVLERLAAVHREELRRIGPQLGALLDEITRATAERSRPD